MPAGGAEETHDYLFREHRRDRTLAPRQGVGDPEVGGLQATF